MVELRPATSGDLAGIHEVWWADGNSVGKDNPWFNHVLRTGRMIVALDADKVIGFAGAREVGETNVVSDFFVNPDRRGEGLGTRLLKAVLPSTGELMTLASQDPKAQAAYRRLGMEPVADCLYVKATGSFSSGAISEGAFPARPKDFEHLRDDLGCRFVRALSQSKAAISAISIEASILGPEDEPATAFDLILGAAGSSSVEVQISESHLAFGSFEFTEVDRDTLMATPGAQLPDYRRITFNGDLLDVG